MRARLAKESDAPAIFRLIALYAEQGLLLPRAEEEIRRNIGHFIVLSERGKLIACVALEYYGADLAEIRSLAVDPGLRGQGIGVKAVSFALSEARRRGIARVFAVTHAPEFFVRRGFQPVRRQSLAEKIERDCRACPMHRTCRLAAVIATVLPECDFLPVLGDLATPISVP